MRFSHSASSKNSNFPHPTGATGRVKLEMQDPLNDIQVVQQELKKLIGQEMVHKTDGWSELRTALAKWVNELIQHNLSELIRVLYRVDISENKLKFLLREKVGEDAAFIIADLIIERQIQKIKTRQQFQQPPPDNEEDRW
jgi:uncharacterized protein YqgQ